MEKCNCESLTKEKLLKRLKELKTETDKWSNKIRSDITPLEAHEEADDLLLNYISDIEITKAFDAIEKWYE